MRRTFLVVLFFGFAQPLFAQPQGNERFLKIVNRLVEAMNKQDYEGIVREYDKGMSVAFPLFKTTYFFKNNFDTFGKILKVDPPVVRAVDQALCVMYSERGTQDLNLYIDDQDKIKGFLFTTHVTPEPQPAAATASSSTTPTAAPPASSTANPAVRQSDPAPSGNAEPLKNTASSSAAVPPPAVPVVADKQQTELYPPFSGAWLITSVGDTRDGTAQRNIMQQQYSCEFSGTDASGTRYKNDGKTSEDYFGYGKEILAPANGTVVEVIDGIRDNSPGIRNPYAQIGNAIVIQHSNKEFSVLAFLKQQSIRVKVGERVVRGQVLAQCGISGNATEPVLHYHLQDSPYLQTAKRIKFYFERAMITSDGKKQFRSVYLPAVGEMISPE